MIKRAEALKSEYLKKIETDFKLHSLINSSGSISFYTESPTDLLKAKGQRWQYHVKPVFMISENGKIDRLVTYNNSRLATSNNHKTKNVTAFQLGKLKNAEDFENAFKKLYAYKLKLEVRKWKERLAKKADYNNCPNVVLTKISPKLSPMQKIGIFED